jgi:FAD/FMN-containing dehydrogenase
VGGITLGGGVGWLSRKLGLTIDSVEGVEIVTADGRLITADEHTRPDLFWAVRGAYLNFLDAADEPRLHETYPDSTYRRLVEVKRRYDPTNLFHRNLNIRPA